MIEIQQNLETNHYQTLRVPHDASKSEIHVAFRRLVKVYHPDKNPDKTSWAEARMRELLEAYQIVSNEEKRGHYDRQLRARRSRINFAERMAKRDDLRSKSKLVLHHLLEGEFEKGISLHEELLLKKATFSMSDHLDEEDYLDSLFLLGEAYESRREWRTAARYYWEAYELEKDGPRKRYFFDELQDRLRVLFSQRLIQGLSPEDALKNYRKAISVCSGSRDAALIYKKIAAIHYRLGDPGSAVKALDKARSLCPGMKAIESFRKKIAGT